MARVGSENINNTLRYYPNMVSEDAFIIRIICSIERLVRTGFGWFTHNVYTDRTVIACRGTIDHPSRLSMTDDGDFAERFVTSDGDNIYTYKRRHKVNMDELENFIANEMNREVDSKRGTEREVSFRDIYIIPQPLSTYRTFEKSVCGRGWNGS